MKPGSPPAQTTRFSSDTDEDLLYFMTLKGEDPECANEAWAEFFERHWPYLLGVCGKSYGSSLGDLGVQDLVADTLIKAFHKAETFRPRAGASADARRRMVRGWLGKIANRLFLTSWKSSQKSGANLIAIDELIEDGWEPAAPELREADPGEDSERMQLLKSALDALTPREREILVASYASYDGTLGHHRMADSELAILAAKYQTTPVNIRKIRSRAKQKVEDYINNMSEARRNYADL